MSSLLALGQQQYLAYPTNGPAGALGNSGVKWSCLMLGLTGGSPPVGWGFCWGEV